MATPAFEEIAETFEFLPDWEERYREVITLGKSMPPMPEALKAPATKVSGCASQVWIHPEVQGDRYAFQGDSDAHIVRGLIAILRALYTGLPVSEVPRVDAQAEMARLGLDSHLSSQRSNGLKAMIQRIRESAQEAA
jgi:cysteine desulfuration protein SufE